MTASTRSALLVAATQIRNEHADKANTAIRIGDEFIAVINSFALMLDVTGFGAVSGGATAVNDTAFAAAITQAVALNSELWLPDGTYPVSANIASMHSVRWRGPGAIQRGSDVFYVEPKPGQQNTLYVATTGNLTNDGITAALPISTVQKAIDSWANYARTTAGTWKLKFAVGTWTEGGIADGIRSPTRLTLEGTLSAGIPGTIIDGTGAANENGLNFNEFGYVTVKNIDCRNWTTSATDSCGMVFQNGTEATVDTCRGQGNAFCDFNCTDHSDMNFQGVCRGRSLISARYYRLSHGSVGDGTNNIDFSGSDAAGSMGIQVRDNSSVVCQDNLTLSDRNYGAYVWKNSYLELRTATISSCAVGVLVDALSIVATSGGAQTMAGNGENWRVRGHSHNQDNSIIESQFDTTNTRWLYGASTPPSSIPVKQVWARETAISASTYNGNAWWAFDGGTQATNYIAFGGPVNHTSGLLWADSATSAAGWFYYNIGGARFRWAIAGTERYSLDATGLFPLDNNARALGSASLLWSEMWTAKLQANGTGVGFNGTAPIAKPTVTGAKGGNAALTSLLTQLAALGLITDSTT